MGDLVTIPENLPQSKENYLEQLEILRPILETRKSSETTGTKAPVSAQSKSHAAASCSGKIGEKTTAENTECTAGSMLEKLQKNAPYNLFFTTIPKSQHTLRAPNSVTFTGRLL